MAKVINGELVMTKAEIIAMNKSVDDELRARDMKYGIPYDDVNHPRFNNGYNYLTGQTLFGYDEAEFMAKQYK